MTSPQSSNTSFSRIRFSNPPRSAAFSARTRSSSSGEYPRAIAAARITSSKLFKVLLFVILRKLFVELGVEKTDILPVGEGCCRAGFAGGFNDLGDFVPDEFVVNFSFHFVTVVVYCRNINQRFWKLIPKNARASSGFMTIHFLDLCASRFFGSSLSKRSASLVALVS